MAADRHPVHLAVIGLNRVKGTSATALNATSPYELMALQRSRPSQVDNSARRIAIPAAAAELPKNGWLRKTESTVWESRITASENNPAVQIKGGPVKPGVTARSSGAAPTILEPSTNILSARAWTNASTQPPRADIATQPAHKMARVRPSRPNRYPVISDCRGPADWPSLARPSRLLDEWVARRAQ